MSAQRRAVEPTNDRRPERGDCVRFGKDLDPIVASLVTEQASAEL